MSGAEISITTYDKLVRESERLKIVTEFLKNSECATEDDLKIILGIHKSTEKEMRNIGENEE